jgi:hypothetical protein
MDAAVRRRPLRHHRAALGNPDDDVVALLVAIPLGTILAIYLSEFAPFRVREVAKPFLEMLGGVPTIVYGYFALLFVTPLLQRIYPDLPGFNMLSAGLVMGIMIIPYVSSLSEDAMRAVPMNMREASYAMGATRLQTALSWSRRRRCPASPRPTSSASRVRSAKPWSSPSPPACSRVSPSTRRTGGHDHRLHRSGGARRPAARFDRLPDDLRRRPDPAADHPAVQHPRPLPAQALSRGLLT